MRLRLILLSLLLVGGSILVIGGLNPGLLVLIALIGGVVIVLDWAQKSRRAKEEFHERTTSRNVVMVEGRKTSNVTRQGALVGGTVGAIHGVVLSLQLNFIILPVLIPFVPMIVSSDPRLADLGGSLPTMMSWITPILTAISILDIPIGALTGCVLGVVFVSLREHIPGSSTLRKSLVFSLILFTIYFILSLRQFLSPLLQNETLRAVAFRLHLEMYVTTLIEFPVLGYLFGFLLERKLKPKI